MLANGLPPPPIPHRLRELLADYPQHLERLQEVLNALVEGPRRVRGSGHRVFELATWALEDQLSAFIREARQKLEAAQTTGDRSLILQAGDEYSLACKASSPSNGMLDLRELDAYISANKEVFQ